MRRILVFALPALLFSTGLASAQTPSYRTYPRRDRSATIKSNLPSTPSYSSENYYRGPGPGDPATLVRSWYERFLRREPDRDADGWVLDLQTGHSANDVVSGILSSQEYFNAAGGTMPAYVRRLYVDLLGRAPTDPEITYWMGRIRASSRKEVVAYLLLRHPQNWSGMRPPPPNINPGYWPDPTGDTFRDPGGPYFHSPYFYNYEKSRPIRAFSLSAQG